LLILEILGSDIFLSPHTLSSFDTLVQIPNDIYSPILDDLSFGMTYILFPRVEQSSHTRNILHVTIIQKGHAWKGSLVKPVAYLS
jgi:hypothetical protein